MIGSRRHRAEVTFRKFHAAIEDRDDVRVLDGRRLGIRPVALETEAVDGFRAKQMVVFAAVRFVTSAAALPEGRLVQIFLILLLRLCAMAAQAGIDRVRLRESRRFARVGIVTFSAILRCSRMLHRRFLDLLRCFRVAGQAEFFRRGCLQHHFSILGRLVTGGAAGLPGFKRRVHERQLQLRPGGLVRIVAGKAIGGREGLPLMSLDQLGILRVMTIHAQSRGVLLQLESEFPFAYFPRLMDGVAGVATLIQSGVAAPPLFDSFSHFVARQADIIVLPHARNRLYQMVLVVRRMWIVALKAIADCRTVDASFDISGVFITMALDAKLDRGYGLEIDAGDIVGFPDLVATQAAGCDCRMDVLPLRFFFMTFQTLAPIGVLPKVNRRMFSCHRERENGG